MSLLDTLEPGFKEQIEKLIFAMQEEEGVKLIPVCGRRTIAEQDKLYSLGRTKPGSIVTNAKGGQSAHNFGLACDLCPAGANGQPDWSDSNPAWTKMGAMAESMGLTWGGHFHSITDRPHVESPSWKQAQADWRAGKIDVA